MTHDPMIDGGVGKEIASACAARLIAFYLPQFHPIPENDLWWGKGFTEWTNVVEGKPLFRGHYQPRIPAALGYYDLRVAETRAAQATLAGDYGIEGFCYWHYWFNGKRLLNEPFDAVLASGEPRFPFCLAWANHNWARGWMAGKKEVLLEQTYSETDDLEHARWLVRAFSDSRYIGIGGRPLFVVYDPHDFPDPIRTTDAIRAECARQDIPDPYLVGINNRDLRVDTRSLGFDETLLHQPYLWLLPGVGDEGNPVRILARSIKHRAPGNFGHGVWSIRLKVHDYAEALHRMMQRRVDYPSIPCVFVGWDNTARRGADAIIMINTTPRVFEAGLAATIRQIQHKGPERRLVFINAWNEWAEGMYLEPDEKWGAAFLEAVRRANCSAALR